MTEKTLLSFKDWKEQNRAELANSFAQAFGNQRHEWPDFAEAEYSKYLADESRQLGHVCTLLCSCCGGLARGRQWHNRDEGYGLCVDCIDFCQKRNTPEQFHRSYGERGIHFDIGYKPAKEIGLADSLSDPGDNTQ